jgi:hypothetical protein
MCQYLGENVLPNMYKLKETRGAIACPSDACDTHFDTIELYAIMQKRERIRYLSILDVLVSQRPDLRRMKSALVDVVTLKCPSCSITIDPLPDACSAILCLNCGNYYCNYCFAPFATGDRDIDRAEAHAHCAIHNPQENATQRDSFLSAATVKEGQRAHQLDALIRFTLLALTSVEHGSFGGQDVVIILLLSQAELIDLGFSYQQIWLEARSRLTGSSSRSVSSSISLSQPKQTKAGSSARQLSLALITHNNEAIDQVYSAWGDTIDPDYADPAHGLPLTMLAMLCNRNDIALRLLKSGANPLSKNRMGRNLLYVIAERGATEVLDHIINEQQGIDWNRPVTDEACHYTMIHVAAR